MGINTPEHYAASVTFMDIEKRFGIAQDGAPSPEQLQVQREIRDTIGRLAQGINRSVEDGREKELALTHLEEALMWTGKAIFK